MLARRRWERRWVFRGGTCYRYLRAGTREDGAGHALSIPGYMVVHPCLGGRVEI